MLQKVNLFLYLKKNVLKDTELCKSLYQKVKKNIM